MTLEKQLKRVKDNWEQLELVNCKFSEDISFVEAQVKDDLLDISFPIYFVFFKNFIVITGNYYEWTFDCTWQTNENGKPFYFNDPDYLMGKLSYNHRKLVFDDEAFKEDLDEWLKDCFPENDFDTTEYKKIIIDNFNEYEIQDSIELIEDTLKEKGYYINSQMIWELKEMGQVYDWGLVSALGCLIKLKDLLEKEKKDNVN